MNARMMLAMFGAIATSIEPYPLLTLDHATPYARQAIAVELHNPPGSCDPLTRADRRAKRHAARKLRKTRGRR